MATAPTNAGNVSTETPAPSDTKVVFDERQQLRIEEIIKEVQSRAARELRRENEELKRTAEELNRKLEQASNARREPSEELESLHHQLRNLQTEKHRYEQLLADREEQITSTRKQSAIRDAIHGLGFIDPADVVRLTQDQIKWDDSRRRFIVVNDDGTERLNKSYEPMSLEELYTDFAAKKPQFVKGNFKGGAGSKPADGSTEPAVKLEDLFGPGSDGRKANALAMRDKDEYRRLRVLARKAGLVG